MDFLSKLFQNRHLSNRNNENKCTRNSQNKRSNGELTQEAVRLVVFQDHDVRGRSLLFDSKVTRNSSDGVQASRRSNVTKRNETQDVATVAKEQRSKLTSCSSGGAKAKLNAKKGSDTDILGEMMFGSVAMTYKGASLKVHSIRKPRQLMITKVFTPAKPQSRESRDSAGSSTAISGGEAESFDNYSFASTSSILTADTTTPRDMSSASSGGLVQQRSLPILAHSVPVAVPILNAPASLDRLACPVVVGREAHDSGIAESVSSLSSVQNTPLPSPSSSASNSMSHSITSLHRLSGGGTGGSSFCRRLRRSMEKSLEPVRLSDTEMLQTQSLPASKRPSQFGIGIVFHLQDTDVEKIKRFEMFVFSHIMLLEGHINKLRLSVEVSLFRKEHPKWRLPEALEVFRQAVMDLYLARRIREPVWLGMMTMSTRKLTLCQHFIKEFMIAKKDYDKQNNFLSTLLTAVLTYHLSWVPTVAPAGCTQSGTYLQKHSAKWLDTLAKSHPYNPLWAQLGDIYGSIGFPLRLSRTVITGKKADVIRRLLQLLTYFIRCSDVYETEDQSEFVKLDNIEYLAKSEEIGIPDIGCDNKHDGSVASAQSYQTQSSCYMCTQCGRNIDSAQKSSDTASLSSNGLDSSQDHARPRLNSRGRFKDVLLNPSETTKSPPFCDGLSPRQDSKQRNMAIMKLMTVSMDRTINQTVSTEGVKTIKASQTPCVSPPFTEQFPGFINNSKHDANVDTVTTNNSRPDTLVLETNHNSQITPAEEQTISTQNGANRNKLVQKEVNYDYMDNPDIVTKASTIWYVTLEEMNAADKQSKLPDCSSAVNLGQSQNASPNKSPAQQSVTQLGEESSTMERTLDHETSEKLEPKQTNNCNICDIICVCDNKNVDSDKFHYQNVHTLPQVDEASSDIEAADKVLNDSDHELSCSQNPQFHRVKLYSVDTSVSHGSCNNGCYESQPSSGAINKTNSFHRILDSEKKSGNSLGAGTQKVHKKFFPEANVSLYPTLDENTIPQDFYVQGLSHEHSAEHSERLHTFAEETNSQGSHRANENRHSLLYPNLDDNIATDNTLSQAKAVTMVYQSKRPISHQHEMVSYPRIELPVKIGEQDFVANDGNNDCVMRTKTQDEANVTHSLRAQKTKSESALTENNLAVHRRSKLTSCPDELNLQKIHETTPVIEDNKRECVRFVGKMADSRLEEVSLDQESKIYGDHMSSKNTVEESNKINKLDSGVFELVLPSEKTSESASNTTTNDSESKRLCEESGQTRPLPLRLESCDSILDDNTPLPVFLDEVTERKDRSSSLYKRLLSEGSVSVFDEYYNEVEETNLPSSYLLENHVDKCNVQSNRDAEENTTSLSNKSESAEDTKSGKVKFTHKRVLSNQSSEIDVHSLFSDTDSICSDCSNRVDRSNSFSVTSHKRKRAPFRKQTSLPSGTPGRCRSVTPTELGRRRNASSSSTLVQNLVDELCETPELSMHEVTMPSSPTQETPQQVASPTACNLGRSLLADYSDHYLADFALQGTSDPGYYLKLHQDLAQAVQHSVLDERIAESIGIVADTDKWKVKVLSCEFSPARDQESARVHDQELRPSRLVQNIVDSLYNLSRLKMSPEFCVMHLEDRLQEVYFKSRMLSEYLKVNSKLDLKELAAALGFCESDIPLLMAVAGTHTPQLALGLFNIKN